MPDMSTVPAPRVTPGDADATISRTVRAIIAYQGPGARARVIAALGHASAETTQVYVEVAALNVAAAVMAAAA